MLTAYNDPSGVTVHRVNPDATIGRGVPQPNRLDHLRKYEIEVGPDSLFWAGMVELS